MARRMEAVLKHGGADRAQFSSNRSSHGSPNSDRPHSGELTTPYVNTIPTEEQPLFPGERASNARSRAVRWNAMARC